MDIEIRKLEIDRSHKLLKLAVFSKFGNQADEVDILQKNIIIDLVSDHLPTSLGKCSDLEVFIA